MTIPNDTPQMTSPTDDPDDNAEDSPTQVTALDDNPDDTQQLLSGLTSGLNCNQGVLIRFSSGLSSMSSSGLSVVIWGCRQGRLPDCQVVI